MSRKPLPLPPAISLEDARAQVIAKQSKHPVNVPPPAEKLAKRLGNSSGYPAAIDVLTALTTNQPLPDFIWPGFLAGTVGALTSPGATGKSFYALEAAMAVASGTQAGDLLNIMPQGFGRVLFLTGEDPAQQTQDRIRSIGKVMPPEIHQYVAENLAIICLIGQRQNLFDDADLARASDAGQGCRLIVIDTLTRFHQADENSNGEMSGLIGRLERLAQDTGAGVLFLHHVSKGAVLSGTGASQQAARGASALIDNARWGAALTGMTAAQADEFNVPATDAWRYVSWSASKINYGRAPGDRWYRRNEDGVLLPLATPLQPAAKPPAASRGSKGTAADRAHSRAPRQEF